MSAVYILAAGGTGGHMFPAQAFAAELKRRGQNPVLITDVRGLNFDDGFADVPVHAVRAGTLSARRPLKSSKAVFDILAGIITSYRIARSLKPVLAVGFGGYPSVPAMIAAGWAGVPRLIHEQNAVLGMANRLLVPRVDGVALSFDPTTGLKPNHKKKSLLTGNPVRADVMEVADKPYPPISDQTPINILVLGGSQGAKIMSEVVPAGIAQLLISIRSRISVVQQCRMENLVSARQVYDRAGVTAELVPFIEDVSAHLATAHLVISRAGASTVAEITAAGRPALLVPYPGHGDRQQAANGSGLVKAGAAWMVEDMQFTPDWVAAQLEKLIGSPRALATAADKSRALGLPGAASALADLAERMAKAGGAVGASWRAAA